MGTEEALVGLIVPAITALIKQRGWSENAAVATCVAVVIVAVIVARATGMVEDMNAVTTWVIAIASYYGLWRPTGAAASIEEATYIGDAQDLH